jgi:hypothetical protein
MSDYRWSLIAGINRSERTGYNTVWEALYYAALRTGRRRFFAVRSVRYSCQYQRAAGVGSVFREMGDRAEPALGFR